MNKILASVICLTITASFACGITSNDYQDKIKEYEAITEEPWVWSYATLDTYNGVTIHCPEWIDRVGEPVPGTHQIIMAGQKRMHEYVIVPGGCARVPPDRKIGESLLDYGSGYTLKCGDTQAKPGEPIIQTIRFFKNQAHVDETPNHEKWKYEIAEWVRVKTGCNIIDGTIGWYEVGNATRDNARFRARIDNNLPDNQK